MGSHQLQIDQKCIPMVAGQQVSMDSPLRAYNLITITKSLQLTVSLPSVLENHAAQLNCLLRGFLLPWADASYPLCA